MPRANRYRVPGQVWHLTHRCHKREFPLEQDVARVRPRSAGTRHHETDDLTPVLCGASTPMLYRKSRLPIRIRLTVDRSLPGRGTLRMPGAPAGCRCTLDTDSAES
jgi:hypothetical protein